MAHKSEIDEGDELNVVSHKSEPDTLLSDVDLDGVCLLSTVNLPEADTRNEWEEARLTVSKVQKIINNLQGEAAIGILTETRYLPYFFRYLNDVNYQRSIAVRLEDSIENNTGLDDEFLSLVWFTKGYDSFSIAKVRTAYRYCPECEKTTKDYGGKKHLYDSYGTLQRDVWKHPDICIKYNEPLSENLITRVSATYSSGRHSELHVLSSEFVHNIEANNIDISKDKIPEKKAQKSGESIQIGRNNLINGDSKEILKRIPDESADFIFLDPPYNIGKDYEDYDDTRELDEYYQWCEDWLGEIDRILKPGGVVVSLNLPEAIYHQYLYLIKNLDLVNWISWDALSRPPAGNIMPTNYPILVFSKGDPNTFNYKSINEFGKESLIRNANSFEYQNIYPLDDSYCKRESCKNNRIKKRVLDKKELTTLWTDVFRLKHNSQREDHPTMLPPKLVRRLIWLFTDPDDIVLDPFNGVGTTTLTADQLNRKFTGIELSEKYIEIAEEKHAQLNNGIDPFEKQSSSISPPKSDNTEYKIPKKDLQLEIKRVAEKIGHVPDREEAKKHSQYDIEYYDEYFDGWADATKAARTTGMTEEKENTESQTTLYNYGE